MKSSVPNDAFVKANRAARSAGAGDRSVELFQPLGLELDEDKEKNVFVKSIEKGSRAEKSGLVFEGDYITMASATFGTDMWSTRGVGLSRVLTTIRMRNTQAVRLVLEAPNEAEEKRRRSIAYAEASEEQKRLDQAKADSLLKDMLNEDKELLKKRKGFLGLW
jgi:C-terminal processing protease CtpA/Prc